MSCAKLKSVESGKRHGSPQGIAVSGMVSVPKRNPLGKIPGVFKDYNLGKPVDEDEIEMA